MNRNQITADRDTSFTAKVNISEINPYVEVPEHVVKMCGSGTRATVLVKVANTALTNVEKYTTHKEQRLRKDEVRYEEPRRLASGDCFRFTFFPSKTGRALLYLDLWMREAASVGVCICCDLCYIALSRDHCRTGFARVGLTTTGADDGAPAFWIVLCLYQVQFSYQVTCPFPRLNTVFC